MQPGLHYEGPGLWQPQPSSGGCFGLVLLGHRKRRAGHGGGTFVFRGANASSKIVTTAALEKKPTTRSVTSPTL